MIIKPATKEFRKKSLIKQTWKENLTQKLCQIDLDYK